MHDNLDSKDLGAYVAVADDQYVSGPWRNLDAATERANRVVSGKLLDGETEAEAFVVYDHPGHPDHGRVFVHVEARVTNVYTEDKRCS